MDIMRGVERPGGVRGGAGTARAARLTCAEARKPQKPCREECFRVECEVVDFVELVKRTEGEIPRIHAGLVQ